MKWVWMRIGGRAAALSLTVTLSFQVGCMRSPEARRDRAMARGKVLLEQHSYQKALLEFRSAAQAMPKDPEPYFEMGIAAEGQGDLRTAVLSFRKALDCDPKHLLSQLKLAELMAQTNDPSILKDAEARLSSLKQSGSASPDVLNTLALTQLKLGDLSNAEQNLESSLSSAPSSLASSVLLARAKLAQHDATGAEQVLQKACAADPKSAQARVVLGEFYIAENKPAAAVSALQQALAVDPGNGAALVDLGRLKLASGDANAAGQIFQRLSQGSDPAYRPIYGEFLFTQGRTDEALHEFERLAQADSSDRVARTRLIAAYQAAGRKQDAERVLSDALNKNPKDLDALLQRGEIYVGDRKFGPAQSDISQVLHLRPGSAQAHYIQAKLYAAEGQALAYRQELAESLRLDPYPLAIRIELAESLAADKQAQAALDTLNQAPASERRLPQFLLAHNAALWAAGDLSDMRKGIDQGLGQWHSPEFLRQDGLLKLRTGDVAGGRKALQEALAANPADLEAITALEKSYELENQRAAGIQVARQYAAKSPQSGPIQQFLGILLLQNGDKAGARAALEQAHKADPANATAVLLLSKLDADGGNLAGARQRVQSVLAADPSNENARLWLAKLMMRQGDTDAAIKNLRQVVETDPSNADAMNNLAFLLDAQKQGDEALKFAQRAVELAPDDSNTLDTLGWVLYDKGLYTQAIPYLERANAHGQPVCAYHLAMAYARAGDTERGKRTLEAALRSAPNLPEARLAQQVVSGSH